MGSGTRKAVPSLSFVMVGVGVASSSPFVVVGVGVASSSSPVSFSVDVVCYVHRAPLSVVRLYPSPVVKLCCVGGLAFGIG